MLDGRAVGAVGQKTPDEKFCTVAVYYVCEDALEFFVIVLDNVNFRERQAVTSYSRATNNTKRNFVFLFCTSFF